MLGLVLYGAFPAGWRTCLSIPIAIPWGRPSPEPPGGGVPIFAGTPSPRAFIFSAEKAVCKDSYGRQCRRNRLLRPLPTLAPVRILTDSVLQRENKRAWAPGCCSFMRTRVPVRLIWASPVAGLASIPSKAFQTTLCKMVQKLDKNFPPIDRPSGTRLGQWDYRV